MKEISLLLHNIRSAHNVGSIFRTADAAGVNRIYLSGYTPRPIDRFGRPQKEIAKTALGAEHLIPWEYYTSPAPLITRLKKEGVSVVGIEQDERAVDFSSYTPHGPILLVCGNEVKGISVPLRKRCDVLLEIPMRGALLKSQNHPHHSGQGKESLNVAVATGIVLFQLSAS